MPNSLVLHYLLKVLFGTVGIFPKLCSRVCRLPLYFSLLDLPLLYHLYGLSCGLVTANALDWGLPRNACLQVPVPF